MTTVHTVGHGTLAADALVSLLDDVHIDVVVDVRSFPGSRRNPQYAREEMASWLPDAGIDYVWLPELGGRRRPVTGSAHVALRNDAFRAYADHMETPTFSEGVERLLSVASTNATAVMCSESVWWRCHRRLLADHLVLLRDVEVVHVLHDGRRVPHPPTDGVRVVDDRLVYDVGSTPSLPTD